jgi:hypothetical protein
MMDSSQEPAMLVNAALGYGRRGWRVLPVHTIRPDSRCTCGRATCDSPGKHPKLKDWPKLAATDADVIWRWWQWWPTANVGIATGTGLLVLDVDGDAGAESLADLERRHGHLFDTPRALTGGGGAHYLFTVEGTIANKVKIAPGLDVRGDDGQIVAPPSRHASGRRYAWDVTAHPDEVPLAPAPRWLLELIATSPCRMAGTPGDELRIGLHTRNDRLFRLACAWRRQGIGQAALLEMLVAVNRHHAAPPLDDPAELDRIAASAARYAPGGEDDAATNELLARALGLRS